MIVAVYGSWYPERGGFACLGSLEEFAKAGQEIGRVLARLQKQLVLTSFTSNTLDGYVAEGYFDFIESNESVLQPESRPPVRIIKYNEMQLDGIDEPSDEGFSKLFSRFGKFITFDAARGRLRFSRHLAGLRIADVVIAAGGADHTFMAGEVALLARRPLIPIGSFGGAGRELLEDAITLSTNDLQRAYLGKLFGPWGDEVRNTVSHLIAGVKVAIIHGRDEGWRSVRDIIAKFSLPAATFQSIIMREHLLASESLAAKWETVATGAEAAIAILTPDDIGGLQVDRQTQHPRARQNVWLEIGWVWGRLGRKRLLLLVRKDIEIPSDFSGIEYHRYQDDPSECVGEIQNFLTSVT
jgi:hypothetical protein